MLEEQIRCRAASPVAVLTDGLMRMGVNYGIVHVKCQDRAHLYAQSLTEIFKAPPAFIQEVAPAIGVHTGIGTLGVAVMLE